MYNSYFGFREKPFKLVPNPDYLFLSKSHEIALAHLTYATEQGEGFVVITGEVGTGKTTLCRNYLESLDDQTPSAYIFNPRLDSSQLLGSICAEFGIETEETQIKSLLDLLNRFLIEQNAADRKIVLLIDEAQGLSVENLELVRMLSNLETTRSKLLQIILVGQPELAEKLDSYELRQLAQRISLNYHLSPLTAKETEAYIYHRLGIATQRQAVHFTANACRAVYHFSGGIPRLINIVCDRALLLAFSNNKPKVSKGIMQSAIRELVSRGQARQKSGKLAYLIGGAVFLATMVVLAAFFLWPGDGINPDNSQAMPHPPKIGSPAPAPSIKTYSIPTTDEAAPLPVDTKTPTPLPTPEPPLPQSDVPSVAAAKPVAEAPVPSINPQTVNASETVADTPKNPGSASIDTVIASLDPISSRKEAVSVLLTLWQQPRPNPHLLPDQLEDPMFYDLAARQYGLRAHAAQWDWDFIQRLDLPVIITLRQESTMQNVYLTLTGASERRLILSQGGEAPVIETDIEALSPYLAGPIYLFWRNAIGFDMLIGRGADRYAVLSVKHLLRQIGYHEVQLTPDFDTYTQNVVKTFQARHDLVTDGLVGPVTKIMLLREADTHGMPHLMGHKRADS